VTEQRKVILTWAHILAILLIAAAWLRSCGGADAVSFGYRSPAGSMRVTSFGIFGGSLSAATADMPEALCEFMKKQGNSFYSKGTGLHWVSQRRAVLLRRMQWTFYARHVEQPFSANANGTVAPLPSRGGFPTTAPSKLVLNIRFVLIPLWLPLVLAIPFPLWRLVNLPQRRQRRLLLAGQCLGCGYDLRETPERCPECGLSVASAEQRKAILETTFLRKVISLRRRRVIRWTVILVGSCAAGILFSVMLNNWYVYRLLR
jgi:hypothetical protein